MRIQQDFIRNNRRIEIISNDGRPLGIPEKWRPVLGDTDILVAIGDMHMYSYDSNLDNFRYGAEAMNDLLDHLQGLQASLEDRSRRLQVAQLGDFLELQFPGANGGCVSIEQIRSSHPVYNAVVRKLQTLRPILLRGNHDISHTAEAPLPIRAQVGSVYLEHGCSADHWYNFANPVQPLFSLGMFVFRWVRRLESQLSRLAVTAGLLRKDQFFAIGIVSGETSRKDMTGFSGYQLRQYRYFRKAYGELEQQRRPRVIICGHTHRPYLDPGFGDGECVFVDAGAFTDGRSDFVVVTNEELAVCRYRRRPSLVRVAARPEKRGSGISPVVQPAVAACDGRMPSRG
jgi:hypothetical protein